MKAIPGDPFLDEHITEEVLAILRSYYGLDRPLWEQYIKYLHGFFSLDLGHSIVYSGRSVYQLISDGFPISALLGCQALIVAIPLGIFLGIWAAIRHHRWQDHMAITVSTLGISVPNFVLAALLQYVVALKWHLLPVARWGTWMHTILPTLSLAALPTAFIARLVRNNMIEVLQQDFIRTAHSKGLSPRRIIFVHALGTAIIPVIAYLGPVTAQILTGSFVVERIFAIPGLGEWLIHSVNNRDYPVIMGITIFYCSLVLIAVCIGEIVSALIDPRIRSRNE